MKKVFLGGTCNGSDWRNKLIPLLDIEFFNPVVDDWTPECYQEELHQRQVCDFVLYVLTPSMVGVYSIAEVVDDSNKQSQKTVFCVTSEKNNDGSEVFFAPHVLKSLEATKKMVIANGATVLDNLSDVATYLNNQ
jgi:hypothetical protein